MSDRTRPTLSQSTVRAETREGDFPFWSLWGTAWEEAEPFSVAQHAAKTGSGRRSDGRKRSVFFQREATVSCRGQVTMTRAPLELCK